MEDPSSLLVDSDSPWQIPYSPLISEEPLYSHILTESSRVSKNHGIRSNGLDLEALFSTTNAGIPVEKSYQQVDLADQLEAPGEFPFGRGITEDGYRSSLWVMGQYSGCTALRRRTRASDLSWIAGRPDSRLHLTSQPRMDLTPIIHWRRARWEKWGFPSAPWMTWLRFWTRSI